MHDHLIREITRRFEKHNAPELRPGDTVRVHQRIREGSKERIQIFEGIVIALHGGRSVNGTFTVRRIASGVGVERVFPLHSPRIAKVERIKTADVRRAKLYYLRERTGKQARLNHERADLATWAEPDVTKPTAEQADTAELTAPEPDQVTKTEAEDAALAEETRASELADAEQSTVVSSPELDTLADQEDQDTDAGQTQEAEILDQQAATPEADLPTDNPVSDKTGPLDAEDADIDSEDTGRPLIIKETSDKPADNQ